MTQIGYRRVVAAVVLLPLLVFSFFSVGTMPGISRQGVDIVICTGAGLSTLTVDAEGQPVKSDNVPTCEWSMLLTMAMVPTGDGTVSVVMFPDRTVTTPEHRTVSAQSLPTEIKVRGPPNTSV